MVVKTVQQAVLCLYTHKHSRSLFDHMPQAGSLAHCQRCCSCSPAGCRRQTRSCTRRTHRSTERPGSDPDRHRKPNLGETKIFPKIRQNDNGGITRTSSRHKDNLSEEQLQWRRALRPSGEWEELPHGKQALCADRWLKVPTGHGWHSSGSFAWLLLP